MPIQKLTPLPDIAHLPVANCSLCPRLAHFRLEQCQKYPDWHNAPVSSFGLISASLLIIGLAPGLRGANRTGRPFTGDYAGELLYTTLIKNGLAKGTYAATPNDGLLLIDTRITNAVRCVPPQNKPTATEILNCRHFLKNEIKSMTRLRAIVTLGRIAHDNTLSALSLGRNNFPFRHGAVHQITMGLVLFDSYHCSRYNTNTRRLTPDMFNDVFSKVVQFLGYKNENNF